MWMGRDMNCFDKQLLRVGGMPKTRGQADGAGSGYQQRMDEAVLFCALTCGAALLLFAEYGHVTSSPISWSMVFLMFVFIYFFFGHTMTRRLAAAAVVGCGLPPVVLGWLTLVHGETAAALAAVMACGADFLVARMAFTWRGAPPRQR